MSEVTVRFWAAAREAAGCAEERYATGSLADIVAEAASRHGEPLGRLLQIASFLIDGAPAGARDPAGIGLVAGSVLEVLPPFAGG